MLPRLQAAARDAEALARAQDLRFALDQVLASVYAPLVDTSKIAVAGHSYGANTAMLVSGARVRTAELQAGTLKDTRIQAAILISAPPLVGQGPMEKVLGAVSIPTLHITSVDDTINLPGYRSTVDDRRAVFGAMRASPRTLAVFNAGGHSIFTDRTTRSGPETSARIKAATRELCALFLQQSLLSPTSDQGLQQWLVRYEDTLDQFVRQT
jgi:predicted dienelactone hydrolase